MGDHSKMGAGYAAAYLRKASLLSVWAYPCLPLRSLAVPLPYHVAAFWPVNFPTPVTPHKKGSVRERRRGPCPCPIPSPPQLASLSATRPAAFRTPPVC